MSSDNTNAGTGQISYTEIYAKRDEKYKEYGTNVKIYASYAISILIILIPLITALASFSNKTEGFIKGIFIIICSMALSYLYFIFSYRKSPVNDVTTNGLKGLEGIFILPSGFSIISFILTIIMFISSYF